MGIVPADFLRIVSPSKSCLSFLTLNCRSARSKFDALDIFFNSLCYEFRVLILTETWYTEQCEKYTPLGYSEFSVMRNVKRGGGVSVLVHECLQSDIESEFTTVTNDYESVAVRHGAHMFVGIYRPPTGDLESFLVFVECILNFANENKLELVLGGDFNINLIENNSKQAYLTSLVTQSGFDIIRTNETRVTTSSATLIDFFVTNHPPSIITADTIYVDISDHLPVFMLLEKKTVREKKKHHVYQDISSQNLTKFREITEKLTWESVYKEGDCNKAYETFLTELSNIYNDCFPLKTTRRINRCRKPWMTKDIVDQITIKDRLYEKFVRTKDNKFLTRFRQVRNRLNKIVKKAKKTYYFNLFSTDTHRTELTWKKISSVLGRSQENKSVEAIYHDGELVSGRPLANLFNDFFVNQFAGSKSCQNDAHVAGDSSCPNSVFLNPTHEGEVITKILNLNNSSVCDAEKTQIT